MPLHLLLFKFSVDVVYLHVKLLLANIVLCQKAGFIFFLFPSSEGFFVLN
jgi:hypothetical protein